MSSNFLNTLYIENMIFDMPVSDSDKPYFTMFPKKIFSYMSHVMRKLVLAVCEQQRCRSAWKSVQSDQHLCCSLLRWYNTSSFYIQKFKPLASLCGCAGRFESYLVANPEDRFFFVTRLILKPRKLRILLFLHLGKMVSWRVTHTHQVKHP